LKDLNTFGLDVKARWYVEVKSALDIVSIAKDPKFKDEAKLVLGGGSNILFTGDFNGLVIKNQFEKIEKISEDDQHVTICVGAGMNWHQFVLYTIDHCYQGLENLSLIPGNVGA